MENNENNVAFLLSMLMICITVVSCTYIIFGKNDDMSER